MKVIIPLAGFGARLRPHTYTKPKPLLNVAGKPMLAHVVDSLAGLDVEEMVFIVGHLGDQIQKYVSKHYGFTAHYVQQKELKGQAHALYLAREYLTGPILIIFVDTIFEADLQHLPTDCDGVLYVKEVPDPRRFGVAVIKDGFIARLVEKPTELVSNLAVVGVYYIRQGERLLAAIDELLQRDIQSKGEYWLADALQLMIDGGARFKAVSLDVWEDCGKPETVLQTNRNLLEKSGGYVGNSEGSVIIPPVHIADTAHVVHSVIGPHVTIADGAIVRRSMIQDSIIDKDAQIEDAMLRLSLIGENARVRGVSGLLNVGDSSLVDVTGTEYD